MIPVILDTDLGTDIDDHWAVAMLLRCPELDIRLITLDSGSTSYRARLLTGLLKAAGRTDIPIGIGPATPLLDGVTLESLTRTAAAHPLDEYPGVVHEDGVGALIDAVATSPEPVVILTIGPVTNLAAALERDPSITQRSRLISMAAFLRGGVWDTPPEAQTEYNVIVDIPAFTRVLESDWDIVLAPIDTCGLIQLDGERYAAVRDSADPLLEAMLDAYREWFEPISGEDPSVLKGMHPETRSSVLFDTLAVYLAYEDDAVELESIRVSIDEKGLVAESPDGRPVRAATRWRDFDGFLDHLTGRLVGV